MEIEMLTISQINSNIAELNSLYHEKFEPARMKFEMIGSDIRLFLDNGNYQVNVFVGSLYEANKLLIFHCGCVKTMEYLF